MHAPLQAFVGCLQRVAVHVKRGGDIKHRKRIGQFLAAAFEGLYAATRLAKHGVSHVMVAFPTRERSISARSSS
jgi:hypothetical protein